MSPSRFYNGYPQFFRVYTDGGLSEFSLHVEGGVAPVISLTPEYEINLKGRGTIESPYESI